MAKFKVGDRVKVRSWEDMEKQYGLDAYGNINTPSNPFVTSMREYCGKVATISTVDEDYHGYSTYTIKNGSIWDFTDAMFEPGVIHNTIVIYTKGNQVIAIDKATGKKGVATCSPEDTFDFYTGADLAFERLRGRAKPAKEKTPKYYNGEIVCVKTEASNFTAGKIYRVKNGKFIDDYGKVHGETYPYISFKDLNDQHLSDFIEVVR